MEVELTGKSAARTDLQWTAFSSGQDVQQAREVEESEEVEEEEQT